MNRIQMVAALGISMISLVLLRAQTQSFTNTIGMEFVLIPPGEFDMGCSPGDRVCYGNEKPVHHLSIGKPFYMGKFEVTQEQWRRVMGTNPSYFGEERGASGSERPVEKVSWNNVQDFLRRLNSIEKSKTYRLPTEAEWEYAARAGSSDSYHGSSPETVGWYSDNSGGVTHPVGKAQPNAWGLYDMLGNVWEWCQDWYDKNYYSKSSGTDPRGPPSGRYRVLRGGSWYFNSKSSRVSFRYDYDPNYRDYSGGFRCVADVGL
jgi:formylglycine-generating enzyme required for sulfatase activity